MSRVALWVCAAICAVLAWAPDASAQCPPGTEPAGERREAASNGVVVVHPLCRRTYIPSGNALIGGTTWAFGAYAPTPEIRERARAIVREQARRAGIAYDDAVDFERYNFVLGVAVSTDTWRDLSRRVLFDQLAAGQYSADVQGSFNLMVGRSFDEMSCHSNGAMVCLAALSTAKTKAKRVVLYGGQFTIESLRMWNALVKDKVIESVEIRINQHDPVPPIALLVGASGSNLPRGAQAALAGAMLFDARITAQFMRLVAPEATVAVSDCALSSLPSTDCHAMTAYR